jgi:hypothetical protein
MMPHLVEMHEKYAAKGLVIVTVSVDPADQKDLVDQARSFLKKKSVPFRNLLLNEPSDFWNKKLDFTIPPCYYVFDRHGKWVRFRGVDYDDGVNHDDLEKTVIRMLSEK